MYEALYRKYRPKSFDDVVGQEYITGTLKNQVRSGRLSHAYLFIGTRGTGKTTCARILAKAVNCEHPVDGNPCNQCPSCRGIEDGSIMDVVEMDAASNNGVEDVRMLRDEAVFSPATVRKRVYIIDEVHMLSKPAFNALLKILEEPPEHLMFILATTELNKVLPTILSRCQRHSFRRLTSEDIAGRLLYVAEKEGITLERDAAALLGRLADGAMRDGLSLLDQCSAEETVTTDTVLHSMGLAGSLRVLELAECVVKNDPREAIRQYEALWGDGKEPFTLLTELAGLFRDALLLRMAPKNGGSLVSGSYGEDALERLSLGTPEMIHALNTIQKYQSGMRDSSNPRLQGELCLLELCGMSFAPAAIPTVSVSAGTARKPAEYSAPEAPRTEPVRPETVRPAPVSPKPEKPAYVPPPAAPEPAAQSVKDGSSLGKEAAAPVSSAASGDEWSNILSALEKEVPMGIYVVLSDSSQVRGRVNGDELHLDIVPGFALNAVNKPDMINKIRVCASGALGRSILLRVEEWKAEASPREDKLSELSRFGNVFYR